MAGQLKKRLTILLKNIPLLLVAGFVLYRTLPTYLQHSKMEGEAISEFEVPILNGSIYNSKEHQYEKQLIAFWATWCTPCKIELGRIQSLINADKIKPEQVLAVSRMEDEKLLLQVVKKRGYTFNVLVDRTGLMAKDFQVSSVPTLIFKDENNRIARMTSGLSPLLESNISNFFSLND